MIRFHFWCIYLFIYHNVYCKLLLFNLTQATQLITSVRLINKRSIRGSAVFKSIESGNKQTPYSCAVIHAIYIYIFIFRILIFSPVSCLPFKLLYPSGDPTPKCIPITYLLPRIPSFILYIFPVFFNIPIPPPGFSYKRKGA